MTSQRIDSLDGLRGLAALAVMITHMLILFPTFWPIESMSNKTGLAYALTFTPLHFFWASYEAVILFYVLSGFVLTRPYFQGRAFNGPVFFIKRFFRIYPPYWASLFLALLLMVLFSRPSLPGLSAWVNGTVWHHFNWPSFWNHLAILSIKIPEESEMFNPVVWTLKYEIIFSLLCPFMLWITKRLSWKLTMPIFFIASCLGNIFSPLRFMRYLLMFGAGVNLAKHFDDLKGAYSKQKPWLLLVIAFFLYTSRWWGFWPEVRPRWMILSHDVLITTGTALLIILALFSKKVVAFLKLPPIHFLGKISYSFFLFQIPIILATVYAFYGKVPMGIILGAAFLLLLVISKLAYEWIELPNIQLGVKSCKARAWASQTSLPTPKSMTFDS